MILLFNDKTTKEQADNPKWVWENWGEGIPCLSYTEAYKLNAWYYGGNGVIGILVSYESAKQRGYV